MQFNIEKIYKYSGQESIKAIKNFGEGNLPFELIKSYGFVKKACIIAIQEYEKRFDENVFKIILESIDEIIEGKYNEYFTLPLKQGGAGTSINMMFNEIISSIVNKKSNKKVDPIEDINRYQSTNDTFSTAITVMVYEFLELIEERVIILQEYLIESEDKYSDVLMVGRTQLQDALPIRLGQVFGGWAGAIQRDRWRINKLKERIRTIAIGGTAIGTCYYAPREYIFIAEKKLREITGYPLSRSQNLVDEISNQDKFLEVAYGFSDIANNLIKISNDLLLYTSSFLNELIHPEVQYGSTIMAAKTNPVILEFVKGLSLDTQGEVFKIQMYCQNGNLQLNPFMPFIAESFVNIKNNLVKAIDALLNKFFKFFKVNKQRIERNLSSSYAIINALIPFLEYEKIKELYKILKQNKPETLEDLKKFLLGNTNFSKEWIEKFIDPYKLTGFLKFK